MALPRHAEVGLLLPDIVGVVVTDEASDTAVRGWRLDRLRGGRCDESMTLHESGVSDGEVMVLSPVDAPVPGPLREDSFRTVSDCASESTSHQRVSSAFRACAGVVAVIALGYSGARGGAPLVAAGTALISAAVCVVAARRQETTRCTLHGWSVGFLCMAGFFVVPGGPGAPGLALGAAAGCASSIWLLRVGRGDVWLFTGMAAALALLAAVTAFALVVPVDLATSGAVLGVVALGALGMAGRLAVVLTGLRPSFPGDRDSAGVDEVSRSVAVGGHAVCTGLVAGSATAATMAAAAIAVGHLGATSWFRGCALTAVLAALLLLRSRLYADPRCRAALGWCGLLSAATAVALATVSVPRYAGPAVVLGVALAGWCRAGQGGRDSSWARGGDVAEYMLLATVVPLACWVCGGYELARSLSIG